MWAKCKAVGGQPEFCSEAIRLQATKLKIFNMTDPEWYCGRVTVLDNVFYTL